MALLVVAGVRIESLDDNAWTVCGLSRLSASLSNAAYFLLLLTIYRDSAHESTEDAPQTRLLRRVAQLTFVTWSPWVAFLLVRILVTPYCIRP